MDNVIISEIIIVDDLYNLEVEAWREHDEEEKACSEENEKYDEDYENEPKGWLSYNGPSEAEKNVVFDRLVDVLFEIEVGLDRYVDPQAARVNLEVEASRLEEQLWFELPTCGRDEDDWAEYQHLLERAHQWAKSPF